MNAMRGFENGVKFVLGAAAGLLLTLWSVPEGRAQQSSVGGSGSGSAQTNILASFLAGTNASSLSSSNVFEVALAGGTKSLQVNTNGNTYVVNLVPTVAGVGDVGTSTGLFDEVFANRWRANDIGDDFNYASPGGFRVNIDSNNNDPASGAAFEVRNNGSTWAASSSLFKVEGETGNGTLAGTFTAAGNITGAVVTATAGFASYVENQAEPTVVLAFGDVDDSLLLTNTTAVVQEYYIGGGTNLTVGINSLITVNQWPTGAVINMKYTLQPGQWLTVDYNPGVSPQIVRKAF